MRKANLKVWVAISVLLVVMLPGSARGAGTYSGGDGTAGSPYQINDANDMNDIGAHPEDWGVYSYFELTADIDLSDFNGLNGNPAFNIIGEFTGTFDGNDHEISNFTHSSTEYFIGLFARIGDGGEVENLGLREPNLNGSSGSSYVGALVGRVGYGATVTNCYVEGGSISVSGGGNAGGLAGLNNGTGTISNCYSTANISGYKVGGLVGENGGDVLNCYSSGSVSGENEVGGLVGENYGIITNCYSAADVTASSRGSGGLVGENWSSLSNCHSTGNVNGVDDAGGLIGTNLYGSISNCYSTGNVNGVDDVGGLIGTNLYGGISNCYSTGNVNGVDEVGGLMGHNYSGSVSNCFWDIDVQTHGVTKSIGYNSSPVSNVSGLTTAEMQTLSTFTSAGWDFIGEIANGTSETWQMPGGGGYPVLSFFEGTIPTPLSGSGTPGDPYLVGDANELGMVVWYFPRSYFRLTDDIDLSGINWSVAVIPVFYGFFDGAGHVITNLQISGGGQIGLFGYLGYGGQISNLGLEGGSVSGIGYRIGGLVGNNSGSVSNCYSTSDVNGRLDIGGLIGETEGGDVSNCYSTGSVSGFARVGGLVGMNRSSVLNCYSTGDVSGDNRIGGLIGVNEGGVSNSFWDTDTQTHGVTDSIGNNSGTVTNVVGYPTEIMHWMIVYSYPPASWDFVGESANGTEDIWDMCDEMNYPRLSWQQLAVGDFSCPDGVELVDFGILASAWFTEDGDPGWNADCDISVPTDDIINWSDLLVFVENWLVGVE